MTGCSSREENHEKADACKSTYLTGIRFFVYISYELNFNGCKSLADFYYSGLLNQVT